MKMNMLIISTSLLLVACGQDLRSKRISPGDVLGLKGLETQEFQKLSAEINSNAPEFIFPKDSDFVTVRVTYNNEKLREFESTTIPGHMCRYAFIQEEVTQRAVVTEVNNQTTYEMNTVKIPINPAYTAVPNMLVQKEACEGEIQLLTETENNTPINFSDSHRKFSQFINEGLFKLTKGCDGSLSIGEELCSSLRVIRVTEATQNFPTYSLTVEITTLSKQGDKTNHDLFMEVSPKLSYFYPYGLFNFSGYHPLKTEINKDVEAIELIDSSL